MQVGMRRVSALAIAIIAWAALAIQFAATFGQGYAVAETLWVLLRFFTVLTNLAVALVMTLEAVGRCQSPVLLAGMSLAILLVGVVYMTLLRGIVELSGGAVIADFLLHKVTPVLVPGWWLAFAPKGCLRWRDPLIWSAYPFAYFLYAMLRGSAEGRYVYPFVDVGQLGTARVLVNAALIAAAFVLAGLGLVALDRRLGGQRRTG